jgi:hypothetical protein
MLRKKRKLTSAERQIKWRAKQQKQGKKIIQVTLSPEAVKILTKNLRLNESRNKLINRLIIQGGFFPPSN